MPGQPNPVESLNADSMARAFNRITDAVFALDEEFRFTYLNEPAADLLEADGEELFGEKIWEVYPATKETELSDAFREARETQQSVETELYYEPLDIWINARVYPSGSGLSIYCRDITEEKTHEREIDFRTALLEAQTETTIDGHLVVGQDRDILYYNRRFAEIWEMPEEILENRSDERALEYVMDMLADPDEFLAKVEHLYDNPEKESRDEIELTDGRWLDRYSAPVIGQDGTYYGRLWTFRDITDRKKREQSLKKAKAQLEAATEAGAVGTWEWHIPDDYVIAGASLAEKFGIDPDSAREGLSLDRFIASIHEDDRERVERTIEEAVTSCSEYEAEYRVWNADNELRWVVARGHVECDDGTPVRFPGTLIDITERKQAERELQEQRNQLETLFDVLPVGVIVVDEAGRYSEANDIAMEIGDGDIIDADRIAEAEQYTVQWADTGEPVAPDEWTMTRVLEGEPVMDPDVYRIDPPDGDQRMISVDGKPIRDDCGNVSQGVITIQDITEQKEYERKLEESNKRLEQFAYTVSHDLQEPLRMVSSYLQLLEDRYQDELDEDAREFIDYAADGADRMRSMIEGLLHYSRVETGGEPFEPVDLDTILDDVLEDLQFQIEEENAEITRESLPTVNGDRDQLYEVFQNIVSNAIEYSGDTPPRISIVSERDDGTCTISVHDEGIGIDPEDQDRIFQVFQRLHTREEYAGTGIGLALCQRIVERHGGEIWVESEPGEGSTFSFTLSAADHHEE